MSIRTLSYSEMNAKYQSIHHTEFVTPNGESLGQMQRQLRRLCNSVKNYSGQSILKSSHDSAINVVR